MSTALLTATLLAATPLGPIKQIDAGVLNVGYVEVGPAGGTPVFLLHGWPYDIHSYEEVAPLLAASPTWKFDDATYDRTAASFDNGDHVDIVIHNYRWRLGLEKGEPQYDGLEKKLAARPPIAVPAITIASDFDGPLADGKAYANQYTGKHSQRILKGIGHNVPQEAPTAFAQAIVDVDGASK
jgi:pimeloyl-ACP methyl ester carboxylesterase